MISLTRINKSSLAVNPDLIKFAESSPDTVITLITGEKVVVSESVQEIIELIIQFRRMILAGIPCPVIGHVATSTPVSDLDHKLPDSGFVRQLDGRRERGRAL